MSDGRENRPLPTPMFRRGAASSAGLGDEITRLAGEGARVAIIADPAMADLGLLAPIEQVLETAGHRCLAFTDIHSDPAETQTTAAAAAIVDFEATAVIGLGGGSALDAAKMAAVFAAAEDDLSDYRLAQRRLPSRTTPLIAVPTTAGTGSEATAISVLTGADGTKHWYAGKPLLPDLAVLDPLLTITLPRRLTLATGLDALVHAIEAATNRNSNPASDEFAVTAIELVHANLANAAINPKNVDARQAMLNAAAFAGIAINSAGTAMAHAIGHALGSLGPVHHGHAVTIAMVASLGWAAEPDPQPFAAAARAFGAADAKELPDRFAGFVEDLGFDVSLPEAFGAVTAEALATRIAAPENAVMANATRRAAGPDDLLALAEATLAIGRGE